MSSLRSFPATDIRAVMGMRPVGQRYAAVLAYRVTRKLRVPLSPLSPTGIRAVAGRCLAFELGAAKFADVLRHSGAIIERLPAQ